MQALKARSGTSLTSRRRASSSTTSRRCCATRRDSSSPIDALASPYANAGIALVVGIESRGFILGAAVADRLGAGFVPVRKVGKLPSARVRETYDLEYGTDSLEMHATRSTRASGCSSSTTARHRRHGAGDGRSRQADRRHRRRRGVPDRARRSQRACAACGENVHVVLRR